MHQKPDYVPLKKLPALCRLLADDVGIPAHVQVSVLDSLIHWWQQSTEPSVVEDLKMLLLLFPSSSIEAIVAERMIALVGGVDCSLADRTIEVLRHFSSSKESTVVALMNALTARDGQSRWRVAMALADLGIRDELILGRLKVERTRTVSAQTPSPRAAVVFDLVKYQSLYQSAFNCTTSSEKGKTLEDLAEYIFLSIPGLYEIARNLRTLAEEIDLAFSNRGDGFWREVGNPFIVECKNLGKGVDAKTIRDFRIKLQTKGLRGGFVVTTSRLTKDATIEIRQALSERRTIVSLEGDHLAAIGSGHDVGKLLEDRFYACRLL